MTARLPGPKGTAPDAGTAAREQHAPKIARRKGGACGRVRRPTAARVPGVDRAFRGYPNPGLAEENRRSWQRPTRRRTTATRSDAKLKETRREPFSFFIEFKIVHIYRVQKIGREERERL